MVVVSSKSLIVHKPKHLSVTWAQKILQQNCNPQKITAHVDTVDISAVDVGTTTRVRLAVEHNVTHLPKHWFVKLPSLSMRAKAITALPRLLPTEVRFYKQLADAVPVNKPTVLAAHSQFGLGSTLVMNDISEWGAHPGHAGDVLSVDQAYLVVEQLAHFHAHFMTKAQAPAFKWLAGPVRSLEDLLGTALAVPLMRRGLRLAGDRVPVSLHESAMTYARHREQMMRFLSSPTPTVVHHDCHPGNLFWHKGQPGFLDWQMVRIGEGIGDISYFLATSLTPEMRRKHDTDLVKYYYEIMRSQSRFKINFEHLFTRYRAHLAYPFEAMVVTLAVGDMMNLDSNLEMIRRSALAVEDHRTFAVLPKIV